MTSTLSSLFQRAASSHPDRIAVRDPARGAEITYAELGRASTRIAEDLARVGVGNGQRVGIFAAKSIPAVAGILGTLEAGAAYVPVDVTAPPRRAAEILADCDVRAVVADPVHADALCEAWERDLPRGDLPAPPGFDGGLVLLDLGAADPSPVPGLAYVLYTSGSTGKPKGVMHTHGSALAFVEWCRTTFDPVPGDRFSSHAPFHFDLSILDLYVPLLSGACVVLIGEEEGKNPLLLAPWIAEQGITVWYSTPSVLRLMAEHGSLESHDAEALRLVLFAGEVFPPAHLRRLLEAWPGRRAWNLYGPTETNVCTAYEIPQPVPADRTEPYGIGRAVAGDRTRVVGQGGNDVPRGTEGELLVHGGTVMAGYWGRPDLDERAFAVDGEGRAWYRTGDIVVENERGDLEFLGRRDRMVKRRGYRVELGEIEAALHRHADVMEAAVVATPDPEGVRVDAYVRLAGSRPGSTIAMKRFCTEELPLYMVPDRFHFLTEIPKTSTDKIDYVKLQAEHA